VKVPLELELVGAARAVADAFEGEAEKVTLSAELQSGGHSAPIDVTQMLRFLR
jgi:hypothetical protein